MQGKITDKKGSARRAEVNKMRPKTILIDPNLKDSLYDYLRKIRHTVEEDAATIFGYDPADPTLDVPVEIYLSDEEPVDEYSVTGDDLERWAKNTGDSLGALLDGPYLQDEDLRGVLDRIWDRKVGRGDKDFKPEGTYQMHCARLGDYKAYPKPTITIYYKNLPFYGDPDERERFYAEAYRVFAHEFFHHCHHHWLGGAGLFGGVPSWKKEAVIESLADYFSFFSLMYGLRLVMKCDPARSRAAMDRMNLWRRFFGSPWPYAYAWCITKAEEPHDKFKEVLEASGRSWKKAYDVLTNGWNIDPYDIRVRVNSPWIFIVDGPETTPSPRGLGDGASTNLAWDELCGCIDRERAEHGRACFHVCQKKEWENESKGGYIYAPNDHMPFHKMVSLVRKGDLIIHHWDNKIRDVSIAISDPRVDKNPNNGTMGWVVDCLYLHIAHEVDTTGYKAKKIKYGCGLYRPFTGDGKCKQGYLTFCPYEIGHFFYSLAIYMWY